MFKKIKYIDPKLYLPNGQPDLNLQLNPTDWKSLTPFIASLNSSVQSSSEDVKMPTPDENTVLFIPMYGDDPFTDQSPNSYSITNNGVITDSSISAFGSPGAGLFGKSKYLYINENVLKGLTTFTLEFDYYFNAIPTNNEYGNSYYFGANGPPYSGDGVNFRFGSSIIEFTFTTDNDKISVSYNPDIKKWHHFKITRDENNIIKVYIDNILIYQTTKNSAFYTGNYGFAISRVEPTTDGGNFNGYIANYHISNIVRTESYINWQPELIFHALLDKESKSLKTNQKIIAKGTITYDTVDDKQCATFDGSSFIYSDSVKNTIGGLNKEVCYAAWFRTTDKTASQVIISCTETGGFNVALNPSDAAGYIRAEIYVNGSYCTVADYPTDNLENNTWYLVLINYNGSTFDLWLNDTKISSGEKSGIIGYPSNNNVKFTIGSEANPETSADQCFIGNIADVRIYNRALTDEQIAQVYVGNLLNYSKDALTLFDIKGKTVSDGYLDITYKFTHDIVYGMSFTNEFINQNDTSNSVEYIPCIQTTSDKVVFGQNDFTYSFWIYKNANKDSLNGTLLQLNDTNSNNKLYIKFINNKLLLYKNEQSISFDLLEELFNKRNLNSPVNIVLRKNSENTKYELYIDGNLKDNLFFESNTSYNIMTLGIRYYGNTNTNDVFNGRIKWFRTYDRALTEDQITSLASQFDHAAGNGDTFINPLGIVPSILDEDTAYVIRRYEDDTPTYFDIKECKVKSVGFFGCPLDAQSISDQLPESIIECSWIGEEGNIQLKGLNSDVILNNGTMSYFCMDSVELIRNNGETDPMFRFTISDSNSKFVFNKCRFSSNNCELDNLESTKMNENASRYFLFSGTIGTFMMRDSKIIHTNNYYDAFQIFNCNKAIIRNVEVYSTTSNNHYNGYAFGFIRGNNSFVYDDYWQYLSSAHVEKLDMKNVKMLIRSNSNSNSFYITGLVNAVSNNLLRMENIEIIHDPEFDINTPAGSLHNTNGIIAIRTPYDYYVKNITVKLPNSSKIGSHALICFRVSQPGVRVSQTQGKQMYHIIDGIDIQMGNNANSSNSETERNYFTSQQFDTIYLEHYAAFAFFSNGSAHRMNFLRNCSIYAPRSVAIALQYVRAITENITGVIKLYEASINVENHHHIFGSNAIRFWFNGEVNIENLTVDNYKPNNNLISYDSNSNNTNTHVYIKNCNCPIQSINYSKGNSGNNSAFIYCPNTQVENGFYMRGHSNLILPVDIHRVLGHKVGLRLVMNSYQSTPFRFPPEPYKGLKHHLKHGKRTMILYFAEAELNKDYTDWIAKNLYVQLETSDYIYDSRIDGKWSVDTSEWSVNLVKPFKYELTFNLDEAEDVYVKLYYNVETKSNGGLFWDPKIGWK